MFGLISFVLLTVGVQNNVGQTIGVLFHSSKNGRIDNTLFFEQKPQEFTCLKKSHSWAFARHFSNHFI